MNEWSKTIDYPLSDLCVIEGEIILKRPRYPSRTLSAKDNNDTFSNLDSGFLRLKLSLTDVPFF